jgi:nucleoid DNA-binding protein
MSLNPEIGEEIKRPALIKDIAYAGNLTLAEAKLAYSATVAAIAHNLAKGYRIHLEDVGTLDFRYVAAKGIKLQGKYAKEPSYTGAYYTVVYRMAVSLKKRIRLLTKKVDTA